MKKSGGGGLEPHCLLLLCLLLAAELLPPSSAAITWFSFYDFWIDTALEKPPYSFNFSAAAQFINLPTVDLGVNLQDWKNFARSLLLL